MCHKWNRICLPWVHPLFYTQRWHDSGNDRFLICYELDKYFPLRKFIGLLINYCEQNFSYIRTTRTCTPVYKHILKWEKNCLTDTYAHSYSKSAKRLSGEGGVALSKDFTHWQSISHHREGTHKQPPLDVLSSSVFNSKANNCYIYIIKTITSYSVRIGLTAFLSGNWFVCEGYIATSYVIIVDVILKLVERHKPTTIDTKGQHWRKRKGGGRNYASLLMIYLQSAQCLPEGSHIFGFL